MVVTEREDGAVMSLKGELMGSVELGVGVIDGEIKDDSKLLTRGTEWMGVPLTDTENCLGRMEKDTQQRRKEI